MGRSVPATAQVREKINATLRGNSLVYIALDAAAAGGTELESTVARDAARADPARFG
jgi:hypothetical protein